MLDVQISRSSSTHDADLGLSRGPPHDNGDEVGKEHESQQDGEAASDVSVVRSILERHLVAEQVKLVQHVAHLPEERTTVVVAFTGAAFAALVVLLLLLRRRLHGSVVLLR